MRIRLTYLLLLTLFTTSVKAQKYDLNLKSTVDSLFQQYFNNQTPGAAVAISLNGEIVLSKEYGLANLEHNIPITNETKFHITSGSKQFTAYAILKLEQQQLLSIDDEIHQYLPKLHDFGTPITIKHLLTHTSGIRQETQLEGIVGFWEGQVLTQSRALQLIYDQRELNFEPGSAFIYSNSGYTLLAQIIEEVTKEPFIHWMEENVFKPLGMNNTSISDHYKKIMPSRAESYYKNNNEYYRDSGGLWHFYGGTGVYSSSSDLIRWLAYMDNPREEDKEIISRMEQQYTLKNGDKINWGLGLIVDKGVRGEKRIWHSGDSPGYHAWIGRYPSQGMGIVILSNVNSFEPKYSADEIANYVLSDIKDNTVVENIDMTNYDVSHEEITGWYKTLPEPPWYFSDLWEVSEEDGLLYLDPGISSKIELKNYSEAGFKLAFMPLTLEFYQNNVSGSKIFLISGPEGDQVATKISDSDFIFQISKADELAGKYYSPELKTEYEVIIENGKLKVFHNSPVVNRQWNSFELQPVKKDTFVSDRSFFSYVEFQRNDNGKIIGLRMTNKTQRVQNLWFDKKL